MSLDALPLARDVPAATAAQMAEADRIASEEYAIPLEALMENAAHQIAVVTRELLGIIAGRAVLAVVGSGNNGGDALAALRHLHGWGARVGVVRATARERLRPLALLQHDIVAHLGAEVADATVLGDDAIATRLAGADVLLDGLLGYSASGAPRAEIARLVRAANVSRRPVIAVDLPSGLHPDTGVPLGVAIRATCTVTLALPKTGLLRPSAGALVGELVLADIGIPPEAYARLGIDARGVFEPGDLLRLAPR